MIFDHSIASATGLLEPRAARLGRRSTHGRQRPARARRWCRRRIICEVCRPSSGRGSASQQERRSSSARTTGCSPTLGVDAIRPGEVAVTIGTSGAMRSVVDRPATDASGRTSCYAPDQTPLGRRRPGQQRRHHPALGATNSRRPRPRPPNASVRSADPHRRAHLGRRRGAVVPPLPRRERAPLWNADLRGWFFGLATHHRKEHMIRAVLEGVIFNLHSIAPAVESLVGTTRSIEATGGFTRSGLWRQMMADVFDREVVVRKASRARVGAPQCSASTRSGGSKASMSSAGWSAQRISTRRSRTTSPFTASCRRSSRRFRSNGAQYRQVAEFSAVPPRRGRCTRGREKGRGFAPDIWGPSTGSG